MTDETTTDETMTDETMTDETTTDETMTDETMTDETMTDETMVLEHALIDVTPGEEPAFEAALAQARAVISAASGFRRARVHRGVEQPSRYLLLVEWEHLDDHLVGFRQSDAFRQWRALLGPYFAADPAVDHFTVIGEPIGPGCR